MAPIEQNESASQEPRGEAAHRQAGCHDGKCGV